MAACEGYVYGVGGLQGQPAIQSFTSDRSQRISDAHAHFQNAVLQGNCFIASNTAAITFGTALTATGVTAHLTNPFGSGVNAVLWKTVVTVVTSTTAGSIVYAFNGLGGVSTAVVHGTPGIVNPAKLGIPGVAGAGAAKCLFDTAATLPATPTLLRPICFGPVTATATTGAIIDYVDGEIVLQPGTALSVQGITIVGTGFVSFTWEEIPAANF